MENIKNWIKNTFFYFIFLPLGHETFQLQWFYINLKLKKHEKVLFFYFSCSIYMF